MSLSEEDPTVAFAIFETIPTLPVIGSGSGEANSWLVNSEKFGPVPTSAISAFTRVDFCENARTIDARRGRR
jgi:hypothetical protein